jgi:hypothetical protein
MSCGCTSFWKRGAKVCSNNLVARMSIPDKEILATIQDDVCRPAVVVEEAIRLALEELAPARADQARARLEAERTTARAECARLDRA